MISKNDFRLIGLSELLAWIIARWQFFLLQFLLFLTQNSSGEGGFPRSATDFSPLPTFIQFFKLCCHVDHCVVMLSEKILVPCLLNSGV